MSLLLNCQNISKSFGSRTLFEELNLSIFLNDRIGLIGPNGVGKSTLLKIFAGLESSNAGLISTKRGLNIQYVPQTCEFPNKSTTEVLLDSLLNVDMPHYEKERLVNTWLSKLGFTTEQIPACHLSGGWKKRLSIAQALILSPDLLLLDEPTNHLDLEGILWLEKFLLRESTTYLLVSHDRYFLQNMTNRIIEINPVYPDGLFSLQTSFNQFLEKKEEFLKGQVELQRSLASKAKKELDWLRTSPKARTTKAKSRVDSAELLLDELAQIQVRNQSKIAQIDFTASHRETKKLIVCKNIAKQFGEKFFFRNLDFTLSPGTRMGLLGSNGTGKTTLLRLLADEILPDLGTIKKADGLQVVYFDQHRMQLPETLSLKRALSPTSDYVNFRGQQIHVNGWCKRFLFSPDILDLPIEKLSGGEKARISIARLMLQPADILLLDEPTNDLDIATLETLENNLIDFPGAIVLISHDRFMLNKICNQFLVLGNPNHVPILAEYAQWEKSFNKEPPSPKPSKEVKEKPQVSPKSQLTYHEKKEFLQIEDKILNLEEELKQFHTLLENATQNPSDLQLLCEKIGESESAIEKLYNRWTELEKKTQEGTSP